MSRIQQLDALVINKIAAGEVIERPASIVKELLENSVDALSTRIEVDVAQGGTELIRVVDNGEGIHPDDFLLAISSHATSKIQNAEDLFSVQTLGFRGEALASIAAVSHLTIRSKQADAKVGNEIEVRSGQYDAPHPVGCPNGTQIEIRQLFNSTPVRRKFLKTTGTEFGHIAEQFTRVALANSNLHAVLRHNNKIVYELPATHRLIERLQLFYGSELAEKLIWVESELNGIRLWGYVAHPSHSKSTRKGQYLFLNGRWIQDRSLQHALKEAYRGLLMVGRNPVCYLFLEVPPDLVDVNVHPTKSEVRFVDSQPLYRQMLSTLRNKFLSMDLDSTLSVSDKMSTTPQDVPTSTTQKQLELKANMDQWVSSIASPTTSPSSPNGPSVSAGEYSPAPAPANSIPLSAVTIGANISQPIASATETETTATDATDVENSASSDLAASGAQKTSNSAFRALQIHDCYLVLETEEGVTVIDQHALHERILYEYFRERILNGNAESQRLLVPETIELSPEEAVVTLEQKEVLAQIGLGIEDFGNNTLLINAYPPMLAKANLAQLVRDIAEQLLATGKSPSKRDILDELLHMMSCKAAIKSGQRLAAEEIDSLLEQRHLVDDAHHCPHGRPTALVLTRAELDRQFGRLG